MNVLPLPPIRRLLRRLTLGPQGGLHYQAVQHHASMARFWLARSDEYQARQREQAKHEQTYYEQRGWS